MIRIPHWINGAPATPASGNWLDVHEPATGRIHGHVADGCAKDVDRAVQAAQTAFPAWSALQPATRADWMRRLAAGIERRLPEFAAAESRDNGKPVHIAAAVDIPRSILNLRWFAGAVEHLRESQTSTSNSITHTTARKPLGVVGCISPWNLPLYLFTWKIAPALAAGNCVVGKPSEVTPLTAHMLGEVAADIGFPPGVLNIVHGRGPSAGEALVAHTAVRAISFTGSTTVGRHIATRAAPRLLKVSLELGGKNPTVIFPDADLDRAAREAARAAFANQGEICLCGSRILVHSDIYESFRERLVNHVSAFNVGDPNEKTTHVGALVSEAHFRKVCDHLDVAKAEGARVLTGGSAVRVEGRCAGGWFVAPTLLEGLSPSCRTNQEEIFGPVATLLPFSTEDEAIAIANGTEFGLAASVWTGSLPRAHRLSHALDSGLVWVNCWMERDLGTPFGGVKQSGVGREGGRHALDFFSDLKTITVDHE